MMSKHYRSLIEHYVTGAVMGISLLAVYATQESIWLVPTGITFVALCAHIGQAIEMNLKDKEEYHD